VIGLITEWLTADGRFEHRSADSDLGGSMRLGGQICLLDAGSLAREVYGRDQIVERHRHRYEVNNALRGKLEAAGLRVECHRKIPNKEMFKNLERVWRRLGRQPVCSEMVRPFSTCSPNSYIRRFGGWRKALKAFIVWASDENTSEDGEVSRPPEPRSGPREPSLSLRFAVLRGNSFKCQACGRSPATEAGVRLHVDHKIPWHLGGPTTLENLTTLCDRCNFGKGGSVS
jgi:5-methylcytosine-specific restriction endonuclease McrA